MSYRSRVRARFEFFLRMLRAASPFTRMPSIGTSLDGWKKSTFSMASLSFSSSSKAPPEAKEPEDSKKVEGCGGEGKEGSDGKTRLVCDACDGPHLTKDCPYYKKARDAHPDAVRPTLPCNMLPALTTAACWQVRRPGLGKAGLSSSAGNFSLPGIRFQTSRACPPCPASELCCFVSQKNSCC